MKKIFAVVLLLVGIGLSGAVVISPSGSYFFGDDIFVAGYFEGNCNGNISLFMDGRLVDEKNYSFSGVTDLREVFPEKLNASLGQHVLKIESSCFEPAETSFEVSNDIKIGFSLNKLEAMTGEEIKLGAYGIRGKEVVPCKIYSDGTVYENEMKMSFSAPGEKKIEIKCEDSYGNYGEKNLTVKVFDLLKGNLSINKNFFGPGEEVKMNLTPVDYFGREVQVNAYALFDGKKHFFEKKGSHYGVAFNLTENQEPGTYPIEVVFEKGKNKGNYSVNITVVNVVTDAKVIIDEKRSNATSTFLKIVVLNQNNVPFVEKINVTIEFEGGVVEKEVETNKYFEVPAGATLKVEGKSFEFEKKFPKEDVEKNKMTGLATGSNENLKGFFIGSVLFVLIIGSVLFLRNSELIAKI